MICAKCKEDTLEISYDTEFLPLGKIAYECWNQDCNHYEIRDIK